MRGDRDRDGGVDPRQLLDGDRVRDGVAARAAVLLRDRKAQQAQLPELRDELVGEAARQIELFGDGCDPFSRKRPDRVANELLLGSQVEVHAARMVSAR